MKINQYSDIISNSVIGSSFVTEMGRNFIVGVRNTTDHELLNQSEKLFHSGFWTKDRL